MENSTTPTTAIVPQPERAPVAIGKHGIELRSMDELARFAQAVAKSGLAPKGIQSAEAIAIAVQMGLEVGLSPMAALQNIAVINGRPSIWGDAMLAVARGSGAMESFAEWFEEGGKKLPRNPDKYTDTTAAVCRVKRVNEDPIEVAFSVADAKAAGLWGKDGPWKQYPFRMLKSRARAFALRDAFGDALKGIRSAEEVMDIPAEEARFAAAKPVSSADTLFGEPPVKPAPAKAPELTPQGKAIRDRVEKAGKSFDDFRQHINKISPDADSWGSWSDVPHSVYADLIENPQIIKPLTQ